MEKINSFEEQENCLSKFHKLLGVLWNFEIDELFFDLKNVVSESQISTKREFSKVLSSDYDPLGIIYLTVITLKMLFQKICMMKTNRDDVLPETKITEWQNILENVNVMITNKIYRSLNTIGETDCRLSEKVIDHNGWDKNSHIFIEREHILTFSHILT